MNKDIQENIISDNDYSAILEEQIASLILENDLIHSLKKAHMHIICFYFLSSSLIGLSFLVFQYDMICFISMLIICWASYIVTYNHRSLVNRLISTLDDSNKCRIKFCDIIEKKRAYYGAK